MSARPRRVALSEREASMVLSNPCAPMRHLLSRTKAEAFWVAMGGLDGDFSDDNCAAAIYVVRPRRGARR